MRLEEVYVKEAKKSFESFNGNSEKHSLVVKDMVLQYRALNEIKYNTRRLKNTIKSIEPEKCSIPFYVFSPVEKKNGNSKIFTFEHKTGMFKVTLKNGLNGVIAFYESGFGKSRQGESILVASEDFIKELYKLTRYTQKKMNTPKIGVYKAFMGQFGIQYSKYSPKSSTVIHPVAETVEKSIETHFSRLEKRKYFDRKTLLYSKIGTGKTEFLKNMALKYKNTHSVIFTDDIGAMLEHQMKCAKSNVPTIIMLEEAEEAIAKYNVNANMVRVNSSVKNALSGYMHEKNKAGCYVIMTTNFPERINKSISQRRERVDEMYNFGELTGEYALKCVKLYLGDERYEKLENEKELMLEVFNGLTGVEIKYICEDSIEYCDANEKEITAKIFSLVKEKRISSIDLMQEFNSEEGVFEKKNKIGFGAQKTTSWSTASLEEINKF